MPFLKIDLERFWPFEDIGLDFNRHVATRILKLKKLKAIYSYEDCALKSFQVGRRLGLRCIYELPIGYWRVAHEIFSLEKEVNPEWATTLEGLRDSKEKLAAKD